MAGAGHIGAGPAELRKPHIAAARAELAWCGQYPHGSWYMMAGPLPIGRQPKVDPIFRGANSDPDPTPTGRLTSAMQGSSLEHLAWVTKRIKWQ